MAGAADAARRRFAWPVGACYIPGTPHSLPHRVRALCVGRHPVIAGHIARFFGRFGLDTSAVVGVEAALCDAAAPPPSIVLCEYDLLTAQRLETWERHATLSTVPLVAVSLTRRPSEAPLLDAAGVAGFLYLPTLRDDDVRRVLAVARPPAGYALPTSFASGARSSTAASRGW